MTDIAKLLKHMANDTTTTGTLSTRFARGVLKVSRPAARIYEIRQAGFTVWTNTRKVDGKKVSVYRLHPAQRKQAMKVAEANVGAASLTA